MDESLIKLKHLRQTATETNGRISEVANTAAGAIEEVAATKQDKLSGLPGQLVGFDADGNVIPQEAQNGIVEWENINGRPDLSAVSSMKTAPIVLNSLLWDASNRQTVPVEGVLADEEQQLVIAKPKRTSRLLYKSCGIELVDQGDNVLVFECETVPDENVSVNAFIIGAAEVGEEIVGTFSWWSPNMTGESSPAPFSVNASSINGSNVPYHAFDGNSGTSWTSSRRTEGAYIWFDFGEEAYIHGLRMMPQQNLSSFPHTGTIEGSNNDIDWVEITSFSELPDPDTREFREHMFDKPVKYRYYRISNMRSNYLGDNIYSGYVSMSEIEFYKLEIQH